MGINTDIEITEATVNDAEELAETRLTFLKELGQSPDDHFLRVTADYFRKNIGGSSLIANIAKCDGKIIATVIQCVYECIPTTSNITGKFGRIFSVYTAPRFRGHGIGAALMQKTIDEARSMGIVEITLKAEVKARPLYTRLGFLAVDSEMVLSLN